MSVHGYQEGYRRGYEKGSQEIPTELLHEIEASLDWAASEARESAKACTTEEDVAALALRAEDLDRLVAEVQGVLRARKVAQAPVVVERGS